MSIIKHYHMMHADPLASQMKDSTGLHRHVTENFDLNLLPCFVLFHYTVIFLRLQ